MRVLRTDGHATTTRWILAGFLHTHTHTHHLQASECTHARINYLRSLACAPHLMHTAPNVFSRSTCMITHQTCGDWPTDHIREHRGANGHTNPSTHTHTLGCEVQSAGPGAAKATRRKKRQRHYSISARACVCVLCVCVVCVYPPQNTNMRSRRTRRQPPYRATQSYANARVPCKHTHTRARR